MVRKNYRDPAHVNSVQIQPPQKHNARVGFYLFPEQLRAVHKKTMQQLSAEALDADGVESIVLFARSTEKWDLPYEAVLYAKSAELLMAATVAHNIVAAIVLGVRPRRLSTIVYRRCPLRGLV
jgi:hypothetical protein